MGELQMGTAGTHDAWLGFARELSVLDLDAPLGVEWITDRIIGALGSETAILATPRAPAHGFQDFSISGQGSADPAIRKLFETHAGDGAWSLFDPRRVDVPQRNRVFIAGSFSTNTAVGISSAIARTIPGKEIESRLSALMRFEPAYLQWGMRDADHLRVLICEGPRLVAYVCALQGENFKPADRKQLTGILPALRRRLLLQERMTMPMTFALIPALLEEIPSAAFVLDARDRIVAFNSAGADRARVDRSKTTETLRRARRHNGDPHYTILDLSARGVPQHALAVEQRSPELSSRTVEAARTRFGWTPRESEIAAEIAAGRTNRAIATRLECAERTVETHVTRLLEKSDCPSRAALSAMLWSMGERR